MTENSDNLKMIIELASNQGAMQERSETLKAQNDQLSVEKAQLTDENNRLKEELAYMKETLKEQELLMEKKDERIAELEGVIASTAGEIGQSSGAVVVVNQYFMLSVSKTNDYVTRLDSEHRIFVGHLFQHTLPDNTPKHVLDQVRQMTELKEKHTPEINVAGDYNDIHDNGEINY